MTVVKRLLPFAPLPHCTTSKLPHLKLLLIPNFNLNFEIKILLLVELHHTVSACVHRVRDIPTWLSCECPFAHVIYSRSACCSLETLQRRPYQDWASSSPKFRLRPADKCLFVYETHRPACIRTTRGQVAGPFVLACTKPNAPPARRMNGHMIHLAHDDNVSYHPPMALQRLHKLLLDGFQQHEAMPGAVETQQGIVLLTWDHVSTRFSTTGV